MAKTILVRYATGGTGHMFEEYEVGDNAIVDYSREAAVIVVRDQEQGAIRAVYPAASVASVRITDRDA
jgi:hypothetical protein